MPFFHHPNKQRYALMTTKIPYEDLLADSTRELIVNHESFEVVGLRGRMGSAINQLEYLIESEGLSCRVFTYGRIASASTIVFSGITGLVGLASTVGIAVHNIATFNPDYEIAKHLVEKKLVVKFKKTSKEHRTYSIRL